MSMSFIFYETFAKQLKLLDKELRYRFYEAIIEYGLYGTAPDFTGLEACAWLPIQEAIDNAKARRIKNTEDGKRGGRPEIPQEIQQAVCEDLQAGMTQKEIAAKYDIAQSSISYIKKEVFDKEYQKPSANIENLNVDVNGNVDVNDNDNDNDNVDDNDISPEISGGEDAVPFSTPKREDNPEPTSLPERPHHTADSVSADPASTQKQKTKPKKPPLRERDPVNDFEIVEKVYLHHWDTLYEAKVVHTADPVINWQQARKLLQGHFKTIPPDVIAQAVAQAAQDSFILEGGYSLTTILSASVLNRLINAHYKPPDPKQTQYRRSAVIESDTMQEGDYL